MRFASFGLISLVASAALAEIVKIGDLEQGSEFAKCIKLTDFKSKTLDDEVEVADKVNGICCPEGYIPGTEAFGGGASARTWSSQVLCGFEESGDVSNLAGSFVMSSGDPEGCLRQRKDLMEKMKCYVVKMDITCNDGSKVKLNGCCPRNEFPDGCKRGSRNKGDSDDYVECETYSSQKVSGDYKTEGTTDKSDDIIKGEGNVTSLNISNIYAKKPCQDAFNENKAPYVSISCGVTLKAKGSSGCENLNKTYVQMGQSNYMKVEVTTPGYKTLKENQKCDLGVNQCITLEYSHDYKGCKADFVWGQCYEEEQDKSCAFYEKREGYKCSVCDGDMCNTKLPGAAGGGAAGGGAAGDGAAGDGAGPATTSSAQASGVGVLAALAAVSAM